MRSGFQVGFANTIVNGLTLINGVMFLGFLSRHISLDDFAKWSWINSTVALCAVSDLYLMLYLQNAITRNFAKGRGKFADFLFRNMFYLQLIFAMLLGTFFMLQIGALHLLGLNIFENTNVEILFVTALIVQLFSQPLGIFGAYYAGKGDSDLSNMMLLCKAIGQNVIFAAAIFCGYSFLVGGMLYFLSGLIFLFFCYVRGETYYKPNSFGITFKRLKWSLTYLKRRANLLSWGAVRIIDAIRNNIPLVLGYFVLSSINIADYVFITRINTVMTVVASGFFSAMSPRILAMKTKGDLRGLRILIDRSLILTFWIAFSYCVAMMLGAEIVTSFWTGRNVELELILILGVAFSGVAQILQSLMWNIILGLDNVSTLCEVSLGACLATLLVLIFMLPNFGISALPLATLIGSLIFIGCAWIKIKN
jgi:O-antigen/teichoic acid export membrane protein